MSGNKIKKETITSTNYIRKKNRKLLIEQYIKQRLESFDKYGTTILPRKEFFDLKTIKLPHWKKPNEGNLKLPGGNDYFIKSIKVITVKKKRKPSPKAAVSSIEKKLSTQNLKK